MLEEQKLNPNSEKYSAKTIYLPLLLGISLAVGILIGANFFSGASEASDETSRKFDKYREVLSQVADNYVDTVNIDKLVDYSIEQMLARLDPHTSYTPAQNTAMSKSQLEANFDGIGVEFNVFKDTIHIITPMAQSPSEMAGLQAGDKIIKVDGENMTGKKIDNNKIFKKLRGKKGTKVNIEIARKNNKNLLSFIVVRDKIPSFSVYSYIIDNQQNTTLNNNSENQKLNKNSTEKIGYIKITKFADKTYQEFDTALKNLQKQGMTKLLLDLRDNPGGYMHHAIKIADEFLKDKSLIVSTKGKSGKFKKEDFATSTGNFEKGKIVVLINEGSASAAEILSGALQDNDRATVVGRRSFGKGLVQMPIDLADGSELRLTISRYYTPSGRSIQKDYKKDIDKYDTDLANRYKSGEMFAEIPSDSVKMGNSPKFKTISGRIVYGGGGISPDVFVGLDTMTSSKYLSDLYKENVPREFALAYFKKNEATLRKNGLTAFNQDFAVSDEMVQEITKLGENAGIKLVENDLKRSKKVLKAQIKAYIGKYIWKDEAYYPAWYETDAIYQKGLSLMYLL